MNIDELINKYLSVPELSEEKDMTKPHAVILAGGSIGGKKTHVWTKGHKAVSLHSTHDTPESAKEWAKRLNKGLSPGEKSYYGMKYHAVQTAHLKSS